MGFRKAVALAKQSTVAIVRPGLQQPIVGAGVFVAPRVVVTCNHVLQGVPEGTSIQVALDSEWSEGIVPTHDARLLAADPQRDLAFLGIGSDVAPPVGVGQPGDCTPGDSVFWVGHPFGGLLAVGSGVIATLQTLPEFPGGIATKVLGFRLDGTTQQGNSGGGVFDEEGRLVGLNDCGPYIVRPQLLAHLRAVQTGARAVLAGVDVLAVLRTILEDLAAKQMAGFAYAIRADVICEAMDRLLK